MKKIKVLQVKFCKYCKQIIVRTTEETSDWKEKQFCNKKCYHKWNSGSNNYHWKGGLKHRPDGYIRNSLTGKYIHRETMESYLGRKLETWENIHHINGDNTDNRIENLEIMTNSEHRKLEVKNQKRDKNGKFTKK